MTASAPAPDFSQKLTTADPKRPPPKKTWAIVPIKPLTKAKSRLCDVLPEIERRQLAEAMSMDVLSALRASACFAGIVVVTKCRLATACAGLAGASIIREAETRGTNAAVIIALRELKSVESVMVVHADLPLLTADDIAQIDAAHGPSAAVTLVPAADGGTNILALSPPTLIEPGFGPHSYEIHVARARAAGVEPRTVRLPNAIRDIDRPEDIVALNACASSSCTGRLVRQNAIFRRLLAGSAEIAPAMR